jgi:hypothetical protein
VSAVTAVPGCTTTRSTRPSVTAAIQRMFSGTSTPVPRMLRVIGPRSTVAMTSDADSTAGAAGFNRANATLVTTIAAIASTTYTTRCRIFDSGLRVMSMSACFNAMAEPGLFFA